MSTQKTPFTQSQISFVQAQQQALLSYGLSQFTPRSAHSFTFNANFDGTLDGPTTSQSHDPQVSAIFAIFQNVSGINQDSLKAGYYPGPGYDRGVDKVFPMTQLKKSADKAYNEFAKSAYDYWILHQGENIEFNTVAMSFSRGSIAQSLFLQRLYNEGLVYTDPDTHQKTYLVYPQDRSIVKFAGYLSPVQTSGLGNNAPPPNVDSSNSLVVLAGTESRYLYTQAKFDNIPFFDIYGGHGQIANIYGDAEGAANEQLYTDLLSHILGVPTLVTPSRQYNDALPWERIQERFSLSNVNSWANGVAKDPVPARNKSGKVTYEITENGDITTYYSGENKITATRVGGVTQEVTSESPDGEISILFEAPELPVLLTQENPDGSHTVFSTDRSTHQLLQTITTFPDGHIDQSDYKDGLITQVTKAMPPAADGSREIVFYDPYGTTPISSNVLQPNGDLSQTSYQNGLPIGVTRFRTDSDGNSIIERYDASGQVLQTKDITAPDGANTMLFYGPDSTIKWTTTKPGDDGTFTTTMGDYNWDALNQPLPTDAIEQIHHDGLGNVLSSVIAQGVGLDDLEKDAEYIRNVEKSMGITLDGATQPPEEGATPLNIPGLIHGDIRILDSGGEVVSDTIHLPNDLQVTTQKTPADANGNQDSIRYFQNVDPLAADSASSARHVMGTDSQGNVYVYSNDGNGNIVYDVTDRSGFMLIRNEMSADGVISNRRFLKDAQNPNSDGGHYFSIKDATGQRSVDQSDGKGNSFYQSYRPDGSVQLTILNSLGVDANGQLVKITIETATGEDNSILKTTTRGDGPTEIFSDDGKGNSSTKVVTTDGVLLSENWKKQDGSHGDYSAAGDGRYSATEFDSADNKHISMGDLNGSHQDYYYKPGETKPYYQAWENKLNNTGGTITDHGDTVSYHTVYHDDDSYDDGWKDSNPLSRAFQTDHYDKNGRLESRAWRDINNNSGQTRFDPDGSSHSVENRSDNTVEQIDHGSNGDFRDAILDDKGNVINLTWRRADGTSGEQKVLGDGSVQSDERTTDNALKRTVTDTQGNIHVSLKDADNNLLSEQTLDPVTGAVLSETLYNKDHSVRSRSTDFATHNFENTTDPNNNIRTKEYNDKGQLIHESWTNDDGGKATRTYQGDGSSYTVTKNAGGETFVQNYDKHGKLIGDVRKSKDGLTETRNTYDPVTGDRKTTWKKEDGSTGGGVYNKDGYTKEYHTDPDGTKHEHETLKDGTTNTAVYEPNGSSHIEHHGSNGASSSSTVTREPGQPKSDASSYSNPDGSYGNSVTLYGAHDYYRHDVDHDPDGTTREYTHNRDRTTSRSWRKPDGSTLVEHYDKDGKLVGTEINGVPYTPTKLIPAAEKIVSPLVLDLNGDGVTTVSKDQGVYFDHDANHFAERSGWVSPQDGLLVRDLDHNGQIDTGRELFGSQTELPNGQIAANGFEALAALDSNGDQVFDNRDDEFASVQVWQDSNGNGLVDAGELRSLEQAGVRSIELRHSSQDSTDSAGNEIKESGAYVTTSGERMAIADVWFSVDTGDTRDLQETPITDEDIAALPELAGMGNVPSLHQAMARQGDWVLAGLVYQFMQATDETARKGIFEQLLLCWAGVQYVPEHSRGDYFPDARKLAALEAFAGASFQQRFGINAGTPNPGPNASAVILQGWNDFENSLYQQLMLKTRFADLVNAIDMNPSVSGNGESPDVTRLVGMLSAHWQSDASAGAQELDEFGAALQGMGQIGSEILTKLHDVGAAGAGDPFLDALSHINEVKVTSQLGSYGPDLLQGSDVNETLLGQDGDDTLIGGGGNDTLIGGKGNDTYVFNRGDGFDIVDISGNLYNGDVLFRDDVRLGDGITRDDLTFYRQSRQDSATPGSDLDIGLVNATDVLRIQDFFTNASFGQIVFSDGSVMTRQDILDLMAVPTEYSDALYGTEGDDVIDALGGDDQIRGLSGNDVLAGGDGNDHLYGDEGNDTLSGGAGSDELYGGSGDDVYLINDANDRVVEAANAGTDTVVAKVDVWLGDNVENLVFQGGGDRVGQGNNLDNRITGDTGNDTLYGDAGNDTLVGGEGNDQLWGDYSGQSGNDVLMGGQGDDTLAGGGGSDTLFGGEGNDVLWADFSNETPASNVLFGEQGDDTLVGGGADDSLSGGEGNDVLFGGDGNDSLSGGDQADSLYGQSGNDVMDGGSGNDTLLGGIGNDVLNGGAGADILQGDEGDDRLSGDDGSDTLIGGDGNDTLSGGSGLDTLFGNAGDDLLQGGADADTLVGGDGSDTLQGGAGDDRIFAGSGDDVIEGGAGNDGLIGGKGNDIYLFSLGDGQDSVDEEVPGLQSDGAELHNIARFNFGVDQVTGVERVGNDLMLSYGQSDRVRFTNFYIGKNIAEFQFNDGTTWDIPKILQMAPADQTPADAPLPGVPYFIDGLVSRTPGALDGRTAVTFSFATVPGVEQGFRTFTPEERALVTAALNEFAKHLNVQFFEVNTAVSDLKFFLDDLTSNPGVPEGVAAGYATTRGEIHLGAGDFSDAAAFQPGQPGFETVLHEIGHVLGLKHPFDAPALPESENTQDNTLMSYVDNGRNDTSLSLFDIAALQYLHGVNPGLNAGDDQYTLDDRYIEDGGGADTLDASRETQSVVLDLNPGGWSYRGTKSDSILTPGQLVIGYGSVIENAIGGLASDQLMGNDKDNLLVGGDGADTLTGGAGNDTLQGGAGDDVYAFREGDGTDSLSDETGDNIVMMDGVSSQSLGLSDGILHYGSQGDSLNINAATVTTWIIGGVAYDAGALAALAGNYSFVQGSTVLDDQALRVGLGGTENADLIGNARDNTLIGNSGNNRLDGGDGADTLLGGKGEDLLLGGEGADYLEGGDGNDTLLGGSGNDTLVGGLGNDVLNGGDGADTYILMAGDGIDTLSGSDLGDDRLLLDVDAQSLNFDRSGQDLLIGNTGGAGGVKVVGYFNAGDSTNRISITSRDGIGFDEQAIRALTIIHGTENADIISVDSDSRQVEALGGNDFVSGYIGADTLDGGSGDDHLEGRGGDDLLIGGAGNDYLEGDAGTDTLIGGTGQDSYEADIAEGTIIQDDDHAGTIYIPAYSVAHDAFGFDLFFGSGSHSLPELHHFNPGVKVVYDVGAREVRITALDDKTTLTIAGIDTGNVQGSLAYTLDFGGILTDLYQGFFVQKEVFNLGDLLSQSRVLVQGTEGDDTIQGVADSSDDAGIANTIMAGAGNDTVRSGAGDDWIDGEAGDDQIHAGGGDDTVFGGSGADVLYGEDGNDSLAGGDGNDLLIGGQGDDTLGGGVGADTMMGGDGNDTYLVDSVYDRVIEPADVWYPWWGGYWVKSGTDTVIASINYQLGNYVENLTLTGTEDLSGWGNADANLLTGNSGNNLLVGGSGDDQLFGGAGSDTLDGGNNFDILWGGAGDDSLSGGADWDILHGDEGNDTLLGGDGGDYLYGGSGDDLMIGGTGNDYYVVDSAGDRVVETSPNDGYDSVASSVNFVLPDYVEALTLTDTYVSAGVAENLSGTGNALDNRIQGNAGDNVVDGGGGNDDLNGGGGNDRIYGGDGNDVLRGGDEALYYRVDELKNTAELLGITSNNDYLDGGAGDDELDGQAGDDTLIGGAGNDHLIGGADSGSTYYSGGEVPFVFNNVPELSNNDYLDGGEGDDSLEAGSGNDTLIGGLGTDVLDGGEGNDLLDARDGEITDVLMGGAGDDIYYVDGRVDETVPTPVNTFKDNGGSCDLGTGEVDIQTVSKAYVTYNDAVYENPDEGYDIVYSDTSIYLPENVEEVRLTGSADLDVVGSSANDLIYGNSGDNILSGAEGNDTLVGGAGDDVYFVDSLDDVVVENSGEGRDTVVALIDNYQLGANLENLYLGTGVVNASGNAGDNLILGNSLGNMIRGGDGNDRIRGAGGDDILMGGLGDDTYIYYAGDGNDLILDQGGQDSLHLSEDFSPSELQFNLDGGDLVVTFGNHEGSIRIVDWANSDSRIEHIGFCESDAVIDLNQVVSTQANQAPVVQDDQGQLSEDGVSVTDGNVLGNDHDPEGQSLSVANPGVYQLQYGSLQIAGDGTYRYTLANDLASVQALKEGAKVFDAFTVAVSDSGSQTQTAHSKLTFTITGSNDTPVTAADSLIVREDDPQPGSVNVLSNDRDPDAGTVLQATPSVVRGQYGDLTVLADGTASYQVDNSLASVQSLGVGQSVQESFQYLAGDGVTTTPGNLVVTVQGVNDAPVVSPLSGTLTQNDTGIAVDVLAHARDIDANDVLSVTPVADTATAYGRWTLGADGVADYQLDTAAVQSLGAGQSVTEVLGYEVSDGHVTTTGQLSLTITGLNDAPVTTGDAASLTEDTVTVAGNVLANDTDPDSGDILSVSPATLQGQFGVLTLGADGAYVYALDTALAQSLASGASAQDVFTYAATDGRVSTNAALTITITGANDAPVLTADTGRMTVGDAPLTGNVLVNDSDEDAGTVLQAVAGQLAGQYGTLNLAADGSYAYNLNSDLADLVALGEGQSVVEHFRYTATDGLAPVQSDLEITVIGRNDAPVVAADTAALTEDTTTVTGNVLGNDRDPDATDQLSVANAGQLQGQYGVLSLAADGNWNYVLNTALVQSLGAGQSLTEQFAYQATDGAAPTTSNLTLTITGANDAPVTAADALTVHEDDNQPGLVNVLVNDHDPDAGTTLQAVASVLHGQYGDLTVLTDGTASYSVNNTLQSVQQLGLGQQIQETFQYQAGDGEVTTPGNVVVTVQGINDAPIAANLTNALTQNDAGIAVDVLSHARDVDAGDVLSVTPVTDTATAYGHWSLGTDGVAHYQLDAALVQSLGAGQSVTDVLTYGVSDGHVTTTGQLSITINGLNDAPVTAADSATLTEDTATVSGNVLDNDRDPDATDHVSVATAGQLQGQYGVLTLGADGAYTYALNTALTQGLAAGAVAQDVFSYAATDGHVAASAALAITITGANDAPVLTTDTGRMTVGDAPLTGNVLGNDTDPDAGTRLQAVAGQQVGQYGTLSLASDGSYAYSLNSDLPSLVALGEGQTVVEHFRYTATDGLAPVQSDLNITVIGRNDQPVASADSLTVHEDDTVAASLNVLANDRDPDQGDVLSAIAATLHGQYGDLVIQANGQTDYRLNNALSSVQQLAEGQQVQEVFSYQAVDNHGASASANVSINVIGRNDAPVATGAVANQTVASGNALSVTLNSASLFSDVDQGDRLTLSLLQSNGQALPSWLSFNAQTGVLSGAPTGGAAVYNLSLTATDLSGAKAALAFNLNVTAPVQPGVITGTNGNDVLNGTSGNDVIDGRGGSDTMSGGLGDDIYYVDTVSSGCGSSLHGNEGVGNGEDPPPPGHEYNWNDGPGTGPGNPGQSHGGSSGSDSGCGGSGGGSTSCVPGDLVIEKSGQGYDLVRSTVSYALPENVEALELLGTQAINGTGNSLANLLTGNSAANRLDGAAGADRLIGLGGNDTYVVDNVGDVIVEEANGGTDSVEAGLSWTLGANLENLLLTGNAALNATGNAQANRLQGNTGNNILTGLAGNDTYLFEKGWGKDTVVDQDVTAGNHDVIAFGAGISYDALWFAKKGNNLVISQIGTNDSVTVQDWYKGDANHVEEIRTADGHSLDHAKVAQLVQAMSAMSSPTGSQTCLSGSQHQKLDPVIGVTWNHS